MTSPENETPPHDGVERIGTVISGRYLIRELLGEGGMGSVYLAEHTHMKKRVALKLLHPEMSDNAEVQSRFEQEAMASAHIEHPNVAAATDFGRTADGAYFLVLEYVEGTSLRDALEPGPLSVARALRIARQMALALERAHESGIVHRDLMPENVMLVEREDEPDFVKVLDFGIAKVLELGAASASSDVAKRNVGQPLTRLGTILGTPEYMAPEQALGEAVTPAADLYGLGVMLYEMLTGKHPFDPPDRTAMLSFHIVAPVPLMQDRAPAQDVPATVEAVVRCLLEKDSKKRYANARALIDAIDSAAKTSGIELSGTASAGAPSPPPPGERRPWSPPDAFAHTYVGTPAPGTSPDQAVFPPSQRSLEEGARPSVTDTLRRQPRRVLIAVAAALPIGFILVVVVVLLVTRRHGPIVLAADGSTSGPVARTKVATADEVKAAVALGPEALETLAKEYPEDASLLPRLAVAYQAQGRPADALKIVRALLAANPGAANDEEVLQLVVTNAAKGKGDDDDDAFALLEGPLGEHGVDALVELSTAKAASRQIAERLHARALRSLAKPEVRAHATAAVAVLLDLRAAQTCAAKKNLLGRVKEAGDARLSPALKAMKNTRGCGFLGRTDCFPCLRREPLLDDAIDAVEARPAPK